MLANKKAPKGAAEDSITQATEKRRILIFSLRNLSILCITTSGIQIKDQDNGCT